VDDLVMGGIDVDEIKKVKTLIDLLSIQILLKL